MIFTLDDEILNHVNVSPYLGIHIDNVLKWNAQIQKLCKNLNRNVSLLSRVRKYFNKDNLEKLYIATIQPCIDYAISIWGFCSESNKTHIRRFQHRAARIVSNNFDYVNVRGHDLLEQLGWQTLEQRRDYFVSTLMYRCVNEEAPARLIDELVMTADTHDRITRLTNADTIHVPQPNCELFRNSFKYRGAVLWNDLPFELKQAADSSAFKYLYKRKYFT